MNSLRALQKSAGYLHSQKNLFKLNNGAIISGLQNSTKILNNQRTMATTEEPKNDKQKEKSGNIGRDLLMVIAAGGAIGGVLFAYMENKQVQAQSTKDNNYEKYHKMVRKDLPTYKMADVNKHDTEKSIWVTFGVGVYDITPLVPIHPGSKNIMMGAGSSLEPFWEIYAQHKTQQIYEWLETYRIGNLDPKDTFVANNETSGPWANEPIRHAILKPASKQPFNGEPPAEILVEKFLTPQEIFYIRNHLPVPDLEENSHEVEILDENSKKTKTLTMADIKKMPKYTVTATIMCGGNRRSEMHDYKSVKGLYWGKAAVGNAKWSGVKLRDILLSMGVKSNEKQHVIFEGADLDPACNPYGGSIALSKAMDERGDVILAYEMNGQPLTRDHGYPLRVIVPGVVGARSVKWISRISVSDHESDSHWQQNDYKGFSPSTDWDTVDFSKSPAIQNMPVTSAICIPSPGESVKVSKGVIQIKGYAWSGGGNKVVRVDITADGGDNWIVADIIRQGEEQPGKHYGWVIWQAEIPVKKNQKEIEIWSKAVDSNYNVQPETFKNTWNLRGVLSHAYSRIKVKLQH
ncbi:sulfite oxidase, mitochondrial [Condylostylus longicornis]|uniref:sulfite oxidase, mitochondrial n=1 Tax=Condylostylus longicornis TaxID=2530218 RepID=UPI00244E1A6A|nr:sulfite oxidase, mitochondrial [Condylostylus longicornis]